MPILDTRFEGKIHAPEFPTGLTWLNTGKPLTLQDLKGKVVLIDFWTYCCINCLHVLTDLKKLERKYGGKLAVIGVHSAKFTTEQQTESIRAAILRYGIEHPVVNDSSMQIFGIYGARAWPTVMLLDPNGRILTYMTGEGVYDTMDPVIEKVIKYYENKGEIDDTPLELHKEQQESVSTLLQFPGKVLADEKTGLLFISDTNHNRIITVDIPEGSIRWIIGSGKPGMEDGDFENASFHHPQGLAFDGTYLYIADTDNHAIRKINLEKQTVNTLAGTGEQAKSKVLNGRRKIFLLNSPWDLVFADNKLFIAMAGSHQIFTLEADTGHLALHAGSGKEDRIDAPLKSAALAQPSGITTDGDTLYTADSETSSIRSIDIEETGSVETLAGGELFEFGDKDAAGQEARFQHPLGLTYHKGLLYITDTYNHKIKTVNPLTGKTQTLAGTGEPGRLDNKKESTFHEPSGITFAHDRFYIADTNNHLIRTLDPETLRVETLQILEEPQEQSPFEQGTIPTAPHLTGGEYTGEIRLSPEQSIEPGNTELAVTLELPDGYHLNKDAPNIVTLTAENPMILNFAGEKEESLENPEFPLVRKIRTEEGETRLRVDLLLYYCTDEEENLCHFKEIRMMIPIRVREGTESDSIISVITISPEK